MPGVNASPLPLPGETMSGTMLRRIFTGNDTVPRTAYMQRKWRIYRDPTGNLKGGGEGVASKNHEKNIGYVYVHVQ